MIDYDSTQFHILIVLTFCFLLFIYDSISANQSDMGFAIKAGYQSKAYPFLPTRTPTDSLPPAEIEQLSPEEQNILTFKKFWLSTPYPEQLAAIVAQILQDRRLSPISNVVCFGIPSLLSPSDVEQFVILSQVVAQLSGAQPEIATNLIAQDPVMTLGAKAVFENHGFQVVDTPAGSEFVGPNTFLMSPFVGQRPLMVALEGRPTRELGMFLGNGHDLCNGLNTSTADMRRANFCGNMLDPQLCKFQDVPCDRDRSINGTTRGIAELDIWWRPVRSELEKIQAKFEHAVELGLTCSLEDYTATYTAGLCNLNHWHQDRRTYNFMAACYKEQHLHKTNLDFYKYFITYTREGESYHAQFSPEVNRYLSIVRDPKCHKRTFMEYLQGDKSIHN